MDRMGRGEINPFMQGVQDGRQAGMIAPNPNAVDRFSVLKEDIGRFPPRTNKWKGTSSRRPHDTFLPPPPAIGSHRPSRPITAKIGLPSLNRLGSTEWFPSLYVSPEGTVSVLLRDEVIVEVSVSGDVRVTCADVISATVSADGDAVCVMHPQARVYHENSKLYCQFGAEKLALVGTEGVLLTMKRLSEAYLVSSTAINGTVAIPLECIQFPTMQSDFTLTLFKLQAQISDSQERCQRIVETAHFEINQEGLIRVHLNGILIRQSTDGTVDIKDQNRPQCTCLRCIPALARGKSTWALNRDIRITPRTRSVQIRALLIDMGIMNDEKAYVRRSGKRIHSSCSGMVVADDNCIISMDNNGKIVSNSS